MDGERFDAITKTLARSRSRRALAHGLAGGFVPLFIGAEGAAADCRAIGDLCTRGRQCCGRKRKKSTCAVNEHPDAPDEPSCCVRLGKSCDDSSECCVGDCPNGVCCTGLFSNCEHDADCCTGVCDLYASFFPSPICLAPCDPTIEPNGGCDPGEKAPCAVIFMGNSPVQAAAQRKDPTGGRVAGPRGPAPVGSAASWFDRRWR